MSLRSRILALAMFCTSWSGVWAQLDTEFWFVAPEVWAIHGDEPIMFRFSSGDSPAVVTLEMPANPTFAPLTINLGANDAASLNLTPFLDEVENRPANLVLQKGIHITSTADISCYYEIDHNENADLFVLKGKNALGTDFLLPFQNQLTNHYAQAPSGFDIVATEDNTIVTIVPSTDLQGHPAGVPFDIVLNQGQTYGCRAAGLSGPAHPAGTSVTSNAPIAITISDDSAEQFSGNQLCFDLLGDQITPITEAGTEFIAQRGALTANERVYILATADGTTITQDGTPLLGSLNTGQTLSLQLTSPTLHIATSEPVLIFQVTGFGCEVGGGILPALECTGSGEVVFVRSTTDNFRLTVLTPAGTEGDFVVNGNPNLLQAADFTAVPASAGNWMYAQLINPGFVTTGAATQVINPAGAFHLGVMMGAGGAYGRFGYFSDFAEPSFDLALSDESLCVGQSAQIYPTLIPGASLEWALNGTPISTEDTLTFAALTLADAGTYTITGTTAAGCDIEPDTLILDVLPGPAPPAPTAGSPLCEGTTITLEGNPVAGVDSAVWTSPGGVTFLGPDLTLPEVTPADGGSWTITAYLDGCASSPAPLDLDIIGTYEVNLQPTGQSVCAGSPVALPDPAPAPPAGATLSWSLDGNDLGVGPGDEWPDVQISDAGWWVLGGTLSGCPVEPDSFFMTVVQPVPLVLGLPLYMCTLSDPFEFTTSYIGPGFWDASCTFCLNPSTGLFDPAAAGPGTVEVTYTGTGTCPASMTASFDIILTPDPGIVDPAPACVGTPSVTLEAAITSGDWSVAGCADCLDGNAFLPAVAGVGTYDLTYNTSGECPAVATTTFEVTPNPSSGFSPTTDLCLGDAPLNLTPDTPGGTFNSVNGGVAGSGVFNPATPGDYSVSYTLPGTCGSTTTVDLTVHPMPDPDFTVSPAEGCVPFVFEGTGTVGGGSSVWSFTSPSGGVTTTSSASGAVFTMHEAGCGELTRSVTSSAGCTSFADDVAICGSPSPNSGFSVSPTDPSSYDPLITATSVYGEDDAQAVDWDWRFAGTEVALSVAPWAEVNLLDAPSQPSTLCLTVTDSIGCTTTTCRSVSMVEPLDVFAPSAFTPDHDGLNDAWIAEPFGFSASEVLDYECLVFDRWGEVMFRSYTPGEPWIGDVNRGAHFAPDGVYSFLIRTRMPDGRRLTKQGTIVLSR